MVKTHEKKCDPKYIPQLKNCSEIKIEWKLNSIKIIDNVVINIHMNNIF